MQKRINGLLWTPSADLSPNWLLLYSGRGSWVRGQYLAIICRCGSHCWRRLGGIAPKNNATAALSLRLVSHGISIAWVRSSRIVIFKSKVLPETMTLVEDVRRFPLEDRNGK